MEPNFFFVESIDRYLFADLYIQGKKLYLISHYYKPTLSSLALDFCDVRIWQGSEHEITDSRIESGLNKYEPCRIVEYSLKAEEEKEYSILVAYKGVRKSFIVHPDCIPKHKFIMATLFQGDFVNIDLTYRYYKTQGVDQFILYYNGALSDIQNLLPRHEDIVYGSWDFPYWTNDELDNHHAQTMFLTMARHRYRAHCEFMLLNDLDEFVACRADSVGTDKNVLDYLESKQKNVFIVPNLFCKLQHDATMVTLIPDDVEWGYGRRNKTIYRRDYSGFVGVHLPKLSDSIQYLDSNLIMYHIVNFHHDRSERMHNPQVNRPIILNILLTKTNH
jgi:hypothetical protein